MTPPDVNAGARQVQAFRITNRHECEALFAGEQRINADRALPVTAHAWLTLHRANLAQHAAPENNSAWWLSTHQDPKDGASGLDAIQSSARSLAFVPPWLPCFAGHFPGQPLLPGVIQLDWAVKLAAELWPATAAAEHFAGTARLKFKAPVLPGDLISIELSTSNRTINFTIQSSEKLLTSGRLLYGD